jgi:hypothetical protein
MASAGVGDFPISQTTFGVLAFRRPTMFGITNETLTDVAEEYFFGVVAAVSGQYVLTLLKRADMLVKAGATDVTTYFHLRLEADATDATGLTITDIDLQYTRTGATPAAKVDASALGAANSAHADNSAFEIDNTDQPGVYRVDWPDAAFAAGVAEVALTVKCATAFTQTLHVQIVAWDPLIGVTLQDDAVTAAKIASDAGTEIGTAVWATAARTLTALDEDSTTLDLDATIRTAVGLASANLDTQLDALPTAAEGATAVWAAGTRSLTILDEDSTTLDLDTTIRAAVGLASANLDTQIGDLPTNAELTAALGTADDAVLAAIAALNNVSVTGILTTQMTEAYAANGVAPTLAQSLFAIHQMLMQFSIATTNYTVKKLDGSTTAFVVTLDDATSPTGASRD